MDQARGVIHQPHRLALAKASSMTTSHERDPHTMGRGPRGSLQREVELAIMLTEPQIRRSAVSFLKNLLQMRAQRIRQRHTKSLARITRLALRVGNPNDPLLKVHILPAQFRLTESAPQVGANLKSRQHPRGTLPGGKSRPRFFKIRRSQLFFHFWGSAWDFCQGNRVLLNQLPAKRLLENKGKEFQLQARRILAGPLSRPPLQKVRRMLVSHMGRMPYAAQPRPFQNPHPRGLVALPTRLGRIMSPDVIERPRREIPRLIRPHLSFQSTRLFRHPLRRPSLLRVIDTTPCGAFAPFARIKAPIPQNPKSTLPRLCDVSHAHQNSHKVPHEASVLKWDKVASCCKSMKVFSRYCLPLHHRARLALDFVALAGDSHTAPTNFFEIADVQRGSLCTGRAS